MKLWQEYFTTADADTNLIIDDQSLFWTALRAIKDNPMVVPLKRCGHHHYKPNQLLICRPDTCETGAGAVVTPEDFYKLIRLAKKKRMKILAVHANYMVGNENKMNRLDSHGLWIATRDVENKSWAGVCRIFNSSSVLNFPILV